MSAAHDPLDELAIPDGTTVEEHDVVTDGDVLIGSNSQIDFGVRGRTIAAGERVHFGRQIEADGDCRLDIWCRTDGSVFAGEDAYIGERTHIGGKLLVSGDLDIGDDVTIEEGFEANGWIVTRNPVPVLVFYFIVLSQFLRLGESDKANEFASALAGSDIEERAPLVIPRGAELSDDAWRVSTPARIGSNCRLHGNIRAESITVGTDTTVFGSLRARGDIGIDAGTDIIGDVTTRNGTVTIQAGAHVRGDVSCADLVVHDGAVVDGMLRARGEMKLIQQVDKSPAADASAAADDDGTSETVAGDDADRDSTTDAVAADADRDSTPDADRDSAPDADRENIEQPADQDDDAVRSTEADTAESPDVDTSESSARDDLTDGEADTDTDPTAVESAAAVESDSTDGDTGVELLDESPADTASTTENEAASSPAEPVDSAAVDSADDPVADTTDDAVTDSTDDPAADTIVDPAERGDVEIIDAETDESVAVAPADPTESPPADTASAATDTTESSKTDSPITETDSSDAETKSAAAAERADQQPNPDSS